MGAYGRTPKALLRDGNMSPRAKLVVAMVDEVAGYEDVTVARLAEWLGCSEDSARRAVREAEASGWLEVDERRDEAGRQVASQYVANGEPFPSTELVGAAPVQGGGGTGATPRGGTGATPYKERDYETKDGGTSVPPAPKDKPRRGTRIPDGWEPDADLMAWAGEHHPEVDLSGEVLKFRDYWSAKAGRDAAKLDWPATFRNWVRQASTFAPRTTQGTAPARGSQEAKTLVAQRREAQQAWLEARGSSIAEYDVRKNEPGWMDAMKAMEVGK